MTKLSRSAYKLKVQQLAPDNTNRLITEAILRELLEDAIDSGALQIDEEFFFNLRGLEDRPYTTGECMVYDDGNGIGIFQANTNVAGTPFVGADWTRITGNIQTPNLQEVMTVGGSYVNGANAFEMSGASGGATGSFLIGALGSSLNLQTSVPGASGTYSLVAGQADLENSSVGHSTAFRLAGVGFMGVSNQGGNSVGYNLGAGNGMLITNNFGTFQTEPAQATLDIDGGLRVRQLPSGSGITDVVVIDANGFLRKQTLPSSSTPNLQDVCEVGSSWDMASGSDFSIGNLTTPVANQKDGRFIITDVFDGSTGGMSLTSRSYDANADLEYSVSNQINYAVNGATATTLAFRDDYIKGIRTRMIQRMDGIYQISVTGLQSNPNYVGREQDIALNVTKDAVDSTGFTYIGRYGSGTVGSDRFRDFNELLRVEGELYISDTKLIGNTEPSALRIQSLQTDEALTEVLVYDSASGLVKKATKGSGGTAVQSVTAGSNVEVNNADPQNPIVSAFPTTTAGILSRTYFTGDTTTLSSGTFYLSNRDDKGTVGTVTQTITVNDNQKAFFAQDLISEPYPIDTTIYAGSYSGVLNGIVSSGSGEQKFYVEIYKTDINGNPQASGITGQPVGDLGVQVVAIAESGLIDLQQGNETQFSITADLPENLELLTTNRVRYHVAGEKVGTAGGAVDISISYGFDHVAHLDVPVQATTDNVINLTPLPGATSGDVLQYLNTAKLDKVLQQNESINGGGSFELNVGKDVLNENLTFHRLNSIQGLEQYSGVYPFVADGVKVTKDPGQYRIEAVQGDFEAQKFMNPGQYSVTVSDNTANLLSSNINQTESGILLICQDSAQGKFGVINQSASQIELLSQDSVNQSSLVQSPTQFIFDGNLKLDTVTQNNSNTKVLSLNSASNEVEWVDKSSIGGGGSQVGVLSSFPLASIATGTASANQVYAIRFLCPADITVSQMSPFITSAGSDNITLGIYDDLNTLIGTTADGVSTAPFAVGDIPLIPLVSSVNLIGGESYWLAIKCQSGTLNFGTQGVFTNSSIARGQFYSATAGLPAVLAGSATSVGAYLNVHA